MVSGLFFCDRCVFRQIRQLFRNKPLSERALLTQFACNSYAGTSNSVVCWGPGILRFEEGKRKTAARNPVPRASQRGRSRKPSQPFQPASAILLFVFPQRIRRPIDKKRRGVEGVCYRFLKNMSYTTRIATTTMAAIMARSTEV